MLDNHHNRQHEHGGRSHAARPGAGLTAPALTQDVRHRLTATSALTCAYDHTPACRPQGGGITPNSQSQLAINRAESICNCSG